jgi:hypothetical protein
MWQLHHFHTTTDTIAILLVQAECVHGLAAKQTQWPLLMVLFSLFSYLFSLFPVWTDKGGYFQKLA